MKLVAEKGKPTRWDLDRRVRDRHLASGVLDEKLVERHLAELPDMEAHAENIPVEQPALGRSPVAAAALDDGEDDEA
jgi:hypothetical protein